jgi:hypothetical protein
VATTAITNDVSDPPRRDRRRRCRLQHRAAGADGNGRTAWRAVERPRTSGRPRGPNQEHQYRRGDHDDHLALWRVHSSRFSGRIVWLGNRIAQTHVVSAFRRTDNGSSPDLASTAPCTGIPTASDCSTGTARPSISWLSISTRQRVPGRYPAITVQGASAVPLCQLEFRARRAALHLRDDAGWWQADAVHGGAQLGRGAPKVTDYRLDSLPDSRCPSVAARSTRRMNSPR